MSEQFTTFLLIFVCAVCIGICQLNSKTNTRTARRFWYSAIASQVGGLLLGMTDIFIVQLVLMIVTVVFLVLSIVFGVHLFKETKQRWAEHKSERGSS